MEQQQTNPMFGRPTWTYVDIVRGPVMGPQPRLAQGTGRTGKPAATGTGAQLPGYISDNEYKPSPFSYQPILRDSFVENIARTIGTGSNGRELVGTYEPHDFIPGQRFNHQMRSAANWQQQAFPPTFRDTIAWQQVQKYNLKRQIVSARPLSKSSYFLGYEVQSEIQGQIGQNTLGYLGG